MSDLKLIMERVGHHGRASNSFVMWACRGEGRGCKRNLHRSDAKHCEDCVRADENETVGDLHNRLKRGDA